jgi:hypothetical protein
LAQQLADEANARAADEARLRAEKKGALDAARAQLDALQSGEAERRDELQRQIDALRTAEAERRAAADGMCLFGLMLFAGCFDRVLLSVVVAAEVKRQAEAQQARKALEDADAQRAAELEVITLVVVALL